MNMHSGRLMAAPVAGTRVLFWGTMLLLSSLPDVLWAELAGEPATWILAAKGMLIAGVLLASLFNEEAARLRPFVIVIGVLYVALWGVQQIGKTALWQGWFGAWGERGFAVGMMSEQLLRLMSSFAMVAALLLLKGAPRNFYLRIGEMDATAQPVRWLGMSRPDRWRVFGPLTLVIASICLLGFLFLAGRPSAATLLAGLPMLPVVLLFAMMNAWSEEVNYRISLISTAEPVVGAGQAVWLSALFFGIGHYYGVPYGVSGVLLAGFFGYMLGKSVIETRGIGWAWLLHIVADVWVFWFMAVGAVNGS